MHIVSAEMIKRSISVQPLTCDRANIAHTYLPNSLNLKDLFTFFGFSHHYFKY